jgi:hypothetical protein
MITHTSKLKAFIEVLMQKLSHTWWQSGLLVVLDVS